MTSQPRRNKETPPPRIEQVIPQNTTAEQAALACLLDRADLSVPLTESHFFTPANKIVFNTIKELHEKNQPVTIMTVRVMLEARGLLDQAGGDPSRYFEYGGGGNACLDYYYNHLEQARSNRMVFMHIREKLEDLAKLRIDAGVFVSELLQLVYNNNEQQQ